MKLLLRLRPFVYIAVLAVAGFTELTKAEAPVAAPAEFDADIRAEMDRQHIPGLSLAVVKLSGRT